ncbi:MAG: hypothetical protein ABI723_00470 [Bacteroidia bacterium]
MQITFALIDSIAEQFSRFSPLIGIGIGALYYKHLTAVFQVLFYLLIYGFINDMVAGLLPDRNLVWPINNIYLLFETMAMGFIMISTEKRVLFKRIIRILVISIVLLWCATSIYDPGVYLLHFNRLVIPIRSAVLSVVAGIMIYDLSGREDYLFKDPTFWVLIGFFIYLFCNMIVLLSISLKLVQHLNIIPKIWFIHNIFSLSSNLIYAYAFFLTRKGKYYASR